jgi:hypothetical protein
MSIGIAVKKVTGEACVDEQCKHQGIFQSGMAASPIGIGIDRVPIQ